VTPPLEPEDYAKIAYQAYGETTDFKNYQGLPMPEWNALTETIRKAWIKAALAAIEAWRIEHVYLFKD
jgi:hypothetical protein